MVSVRPADDVAVGSGKKAMSGLGFALVRYKTVWPSRNAEVQPDI